MIGALARNWWALALRGGLAIAFGVGAFLAPGAALAALVMLFGAYAFVDGILAVVAGLRKAAAPTAARDERWWVLLIEGLASIAAGIVTFAWPAITALALLYIIAAWAIVTGILEVLAAARLRREIEGEGWLALAGLASVVFGVLLLVQPAAGAVAVAWLIGAYGIVFGVAMLAVALRLRAWQREREGGYRAV